MGLYDSGLGIELSFDWKKIRFGLLIVGAIFVILLIILLGSTLFTPDAIQISLNKHQLKYGGEDFAKLKLVISNVTGLEAQNVQVEVSAKSGVLIDSAKKTVRTIDLIGANENRELEFLLRAEPDNKVLAGDYTVNVKTKINDIEFEKSFVIKIVK